MSNIQTFCIGASLQQPFESRETVYASGQQHLLDERRLGDGLAPKHVKPGDQRDECNHARQPIIVHRPAHQSRSFSNGEDANQYPPYTSTCSKAC